MSNRKKPAATPSPGFQPSMSVTPTVFVDQFEFSINGGMIEVRAGRKGETDANLIMSLNMFFDMTNMVQAKVLEMNRPAPAEEKKD